MVDELLLLSLPEGKLLLLLLLLDKTLLQRSLLLPQHSEHMKHLLFVFSLLLHK